MDRDTCRVSGLIQYLVVSARAQLSRDRWHSLLECCHVAVSKEYVVLSFSAWRTESKRGATSHEMDEFPQESVKSTHNTR